MKLKRTITQLSMAGFLAAATAQAALVPVTTDIAAGTTTTWYATNEYRLDTMVYVQTNAVLVIEPGTVVKGGTNAANLIARPGLQNLVSGLWVTRGGKLYATGTVSAPIIFTMEGDDVNNPNDIPPTVTGQWGGVVLMGNGVINSAQFAAGQAANPKYDVYEGVQTSPAPENEHIFGGTNDLDSSGALRYVSIRHTGNTFAPNKELNGLTMGAVGSGTDISYVEVMASSDDGFEWWGGTVNTHHLIGAFNEDDDFDTDQGYRGTNQFWFAIKPPWAGTSDSRGFETDGDLDNDGTPPLGDALPFSQWTVYNATVIGRGKGNISDLGGNQGWNARDEAAPNVLNTVFAEFNNGLLLDNDGLFHWTNSPAIADTRNCVWDNGTAGNANGLTFINDPTRNHTVGAAELGRISYTNNGTLDPRPQPGSPCLTNALAGAPVATTYRGAFSGPSDDWANSWTALSSEGYLALTSAPPATAVVVITTDIPSNTTATWYATNEYRLDTMVYVQTNAVLVIEPGTVVKGGTNAANLIARPGLQNLVSGLWVTRGGKLYATGTVSAPIIFTMEGDDVNNPNDIPPTVTGQWGGVVLMGNGVINSAQYAAGQAANPKYDVYEGVQTSPAPENEHIFGGTNDLDSSGALRYVSIRHTGNTFAPNKELNGLTMGAVGSGTDISYVEVMASSDDGFEWWGGTVNTHHLIGAFNEDDDFDTDQGYRGTNQFWFAIKPPWAGTSDSRGFETDGDLDNDGTPPLGDAQPFSQWTVYNATVIGRGKGNISDLGGNQGWNARDEAAPNVLNTVFAEFNNGLLLDNDGLYHWTNSPAIADTRNCVWDNDTAGNANGLTFINDPTRNHTVGAAGLGGISYTNDVAALDPRPQPGSPALTNALAGAPTAADYRGAFKPNDSWADCWSALSNEGYLVLSQPELTIALVGANVEISWLGLPGKSYQLESRTSLSSGSWGNEGAAVVGEGDFITVSIPATDAKYFQVKLN